MTTQYFRNELGKLAKGNWQETLHEIKNYPAYIRREKNKIISKIQPSKTILQVITLVEKFSQLIDERKMFNFRAEHYLELFVREFAKRSKSSVDDLKLLLPDELAHVLTRINKSLISSRQTCFVLNCTDEKITHYIGTDAIQLANKFLVVTDIAESVIHGQVASVGENYYFRGTAKVVLTIAEIDKVHEGDVLVTTMTSPDFVVGMKKAGAIITDTGGMLSHAAIVSRELKKPCIVGTEIATKVIQDGDVVELHCGRGTVKIVKHAV